MSVLRAELRDLRRSWAREMGLALSFAVGLGAFTTVVAFAHGVLRAPAGVSAPESLGRVIVSRTTASFAVAPVVSAEELATMQSAAGVEGYATRFVDFDAAGKSTKVHASIHTPGFLPQIGVRPAVGRLPDRVCGSDDPSVVAISDHLWRSLFDASTAALGASVRVDGTLRTVAAILPPHFRGVDREPVDVWLLLPCAALASNTSSATQTFYLSALVRSRRADWRRIETRLKGAAQQSALGDDYITDVRVMPLSYSRFGNDQLRSMMPLALVIGLSVLALAVCNCLLFLLVRVRARANESRIKVALGASPTRIGIDVYSIPLLTMLSAAGAAIAGVVWLVRYRYADFVPGQLTGETGGLALLTAIAVSTLVIVITARVGGIAASSAVGLSSITASARRGRTIIVSAYVLLVIALGFAVLPTLEAYHGLATAPLGFNPDQALILEVRLDSASPETRSRNVQNAAERLMAETGAIVAATSSVPFGVTTSTPVYGRGSEVSLLADVYYIQGDLFAALGIAHSGDYAAFAADQHAILASRTLVRALDSASLRCLHVLSGTCLHVVGTAADIAGANVGGPPRPVLYAHFPTLSSPVFSYIVARTPHQWTANTIEAYRRIAESALPHASVRATTLRDIVRRHVAPVERLAELNAFALCAALVLSLIGLRVVVLLLVDERRRDIGIATALGATHIRIFRDTIRYTAAVVMASQFAGLFAGIVFTRILAAHIPELSPDLTVHQLIYAALMPVALLLVAAFPLARACATPPGTLLRSA